MSKPQQMTFLTIGGGTGAYSAPREPSPPLAATADPATSHAAAERVRPFTDRQVDRCAAWVARHPGLTAQELAGVCKERDLHNFVFSRRLPVAVDRGLVTRGEERQCDVTGYRATTWFPAEPDPAPPAHFLGHQIVDGLTGPASRDEPAASAERGDA